MSDDKIASAVRFLKDPKVQEAPLAKKVSFLESKGLTPAEIQTALNQANGTATGTPLLPPKPQQIIVHPQKTWSQTFFGLSALAATGAGIYFLTKKYVLPLIDFPTAKSLKEETAIQIEQTEKQTESIDKITKNSDEILEEIKGHKSQVSQDLLDITNLVNLISENEKKRKLELDELRKDIDELKNTFPKLSERNKEGREQMLKELQAEIKSLKNLLLNRKDVVGSNPLVGVAGINLGKPKIPQWQLDAANKQKANEEKKVKEIQAKEDDGEVPWTDGNIQIQTDDVSDSQSELTQPQELHI